MGRGRIPLGLIVIGICAFALGITELGYEGGSDLECEPDFLAADTRPVVATSCVDSVSYRGTTYFVGCAPVHDSRVGGQFLSAGGDTQFDGARSIIGLTRSKVFILEEPSFCRRGKGLPIAASDDFTRRDAGMLSVPVDAPNAAELAAERAPWIIPGRNEIPQALRLEATVEDDRIIVTNLNRYAWTNCQQIQFGEDIDAVWETGRYLDRLAPGDSHAWELSEFGDLHHEIEKLSEDALEDLGDVPFVIMCEAPRGPASGRVVL